MPVGIDPNGRERLHFIKGDVPIPLVSGMGAIRPCDQTIARGGEFVRRRAEAGDPGFVTMWNEMGGAERFDRRRRWWASNRAAFTDGLLQPRA